MNLNTVSNLGKFGNRPQADNPPAFFYNFINRQTNFLSALVYLIKLTKLELATER
jgi:hypothetical protein